MLAHLPLSPDSETTVEVREASLVRLASDDPPRDAQPRDPRGAVRRALEAPIGFPPIDDAVLPSDTVAVALGHGLPSLAAVAAGVVEALQGAGVDPSSVSLVAVSGQDAAALEAASGESLPADVSVVRHDPEDDAQLCFAGVTPDEEPLLINRTLFEADVTLPVTCARPAGDRDGRGAYSGLYPAFSSGERLRRFRRDAGRHAERWRGLTEQAGWIVGAPLVMQVVPGPRGGLAAAVAGEPGAVAETAEAEFRRLWSRTPAGPATLVIAAVTGEAERQSWSDVARALAAADQLVAPGGAVVVCSELDAPIGKSLSRLVGAADLEDAFRRLDRDDAADTWSAKEIARSLLRGPLYFMSNLRSELVEEMGMTPVMGGEELGRLASHYESCLLLEDSQHVFFTANGAGGG